ncbi:MAG: nicotinamide riboside transporter PnuC [Prevotellaceae bacterium]|jgi:nicotinamide mononucleotide transporter|nr:nicotinamide riboside transporter PnuC [Prevotellaceae bacterium]
MDYLLPCTLHPACFTLCFIPFTLYEIVGALFALAYLWLEIRQRNAMWVVGFISALFYIVIFYYGKFYADMGLNIYYMLASIYGFMVWRRRGKIVADRTGDTARSPAVSRTPLRTMVVLTVIAAVLFVVLAFLLVRFTDSPVPYGDALTTALSIVAMWMLAHKLIEQWGVWFVVNVLSMGLYFWRGLYPTSVLFLIYSVASVVGFWAWRKELKMKH